MVGRLVFLIAFILIVDLYFYQAVRTVVKHHFRSKRKLIAIAYWSITVLMIGYIFFSSLFTPKGLPDTFANVFKGIFLALFMGKFLGIVFILFDDIIRLGKFLKRHLFKRRSKNPSSENKITRAKFLSQAAVITGALPFAPMIYGVVRGAYNYNLITVPLYLANLPDGFAGKKIVQISDLHLGSFSSRNPVQEIKELIMAQEPDIIFFTGDLVNYKTDEAFPYAEILAELHAKLGIFSILGNHDYGDYYFGWENEEEKRQNLQDMHGLHREMGWNLLLNENKIIESDGDQIAIVGVENWGHASRFHKLGDIEKAKVGTENMPVKLLLSHDPSHWDAKIVGNHSDMDVMFAGHTHGAQFGIENKVFKWSPVQYMYKQWAGLYENKHQKLYVNRGAGFIGYPGRVGIRPEITVFELKKA